QVTADAATCSFQFNPVGAADFTTSCDIAKSILARHHINYENIAAPVGTNASVSVGGVVIESFDGASMTAEQRIERMTAFEKQVMDAVSAAGYPMEADPASMNKVMIVALLFALGLLSAMTYAPVAATMVEMFPARIRYTAMS